MNVGPWSRRCSVDTWLPGVTSGTVHSEDRDGARALTHATSQVCQNKHTPVFTQASKPGPAHLGQNPPLTAPIIRRLGERVGGRVGWRTITHPHKVVWEEAPASSQLPLPPSSVIPPYVHDDVPHRQAQLIVLLSLVVELRHGLHWGGAQNTSFDIETGDGLTVRWSQFITGPLQQARSSKCVIALQRVLVPHFKFGVIAQTGKMQTTVCCRRNR